MHLYHLFPTLLFSVFSTAGATDTPTAAPTEWDHGLTLEEKLTEWTARYKTEFRLIRSGTCETALPPKISADDPDGAPGTCERFTGGKYYELATEFPGGVIPLNIYTIENEDNSWAAASDSADLAPIVNRTFSLDGYTFRMTTLSTEPAGLSLDIVNKYVVFNNVPKDVPGGTAYSDSYQACGDPSDDSGDYNTRMMCICECSEATSSPTLSPTISSGEAMTCSSMPTSQVYNNDGDEAPLDIGVSLYDEDTHDLTVRPWINWNSKYLFQNLERDYASEDYGKPFRKFIYQAHVDDYGACQSSDNYYPLFCTEAEAVGNSQVGTATAVAGGRDSAGSGPAYCPDDPTFGEKFYGNYLGDAPQCECSAGGDGHEVAADGSNLPQVTGWVDFLPVKEYPYTNGVAPSSQCRFKLDVDNEFAEAVLPGYNFGNVNDTNKDDACFTRVNGNDNKTRSDGTWFLQKYTNYSFYAATTLCYTNNDKATCEGPSTDGGPFGTDGAWPSVAFLYPDSFHVAKRVVVGTDVSQCRRTWQKMDMKVNLGGFLEIIPDVTFTTSLAAEQDDASVTVPDQATEWQIFKNYDSFQLGPEHYIVNKYGPSDTDAPETWTALVDANGEGQDTFYFDKYYMMTFTLEQVTKLADYTIGYWIDQQYDNLLVKYTWKRKRESDGSWVDMSDRYKIHTTKSTAGFDNDGAGGAFTDPSFIQYASEGNSIEAEIVQPCTTAGCTNDIFNDVFTIKSKFEKRSQLFVEDAIRLDITLEYGGATPPARRRLSMTLMGGKLGDDSVHRRLDENSDNATDTTMVSLGAVALLKDILNSPTKLDVHYAEEHHDGNTSSMDLVIGFGILGVLVVMILLFSGCGDTMKTKAAQVIEFDGVRLLDRPES